MPASLPSTSSTSSSGGPRRRFPRLPVAALIAAHAGLLAVHDLPGRPAATAVALAAAFAAWVWAVRALEGTDGDAPKIEPEIERGIPWRILAVALVLRALLLPLPPLGLSDDLLRYVWDGRVVLAGFDPYRLPPEAPELASLRDERWRRMPHREVATVYPPLALAVFAAGAASPWPEAAIRIILTACDLLTVVLLGRLAAALGRPASRVAWYAWCPLTGLEIAGSGHVDGLGVAATVAAVLLVVRRPPRPLGAAVGAAAAVLAKLAPLVALPLWARRGGQPGRFLAVALALVALALVPLALGGPPPGLVAYGVRWEHAGPLFEPLWRLLDGAGVDATVKSWLDAAKAATDHRHDAEWNRVYPWVYPQLLAKLLLAAGFAAAWLLAWRRRDPDPVAETGRLFGALLLVSATVYPWYLLWVLPWAALGRHRAWLAAAPLLAMTYLAEPIGVPLFPYVWAAVWLPFALLLPFSRWSTD